MKGKVVAWTAALIGFVVAIAGVKTGIHYYGESLLVRLQPLTAQIVRDCCDAGSILFLGDSRMSQWEVKEIAGRPVRNLGMSGATSAQVLLRLQLQKGQLQGKAAVIQVGINDLKAIGVFPERREQIVAGLQNNILSLLSLLQEKEIPVLLLTVLPTGQPGLLRRVVWSSKIDRTVSLINDYIHTLAGPNVAVVDCDPKLAHEGNIRSDFALDTLHLNAAGYDALRELVEQRLGSMKFPAETAG